MVRLIESLKTKFFQVETPFVLGDDIMMIALPEANQVITAKQKTVASGWGLLQVCFIKCLINQLQNNYILHCHYINLIITLYPIEYSK